MCEYTRLCMLVYEHANIYTCTRTDVLTLIHNSVPNSLSHRTCIVEASVDQQVTQWTGGSSTFLCVENFR